MGNTMDITKYYDCNPDLFQISEEGIYLIIKHVECDRIMINAIDAYALSIVIDRSTDELYKGCSLKIDTPDEQYIYFFSLDDQEKVVKVNQQILSILNQI